MFSPISQRKAFHGNLFVHLENLGWSLVGKQDLNYWLRRLKQPSPKPQFKAVKKLMDDQMFQEAREYLERALEKYPDNISDINLLIATCYFNQGLINEAHLLLERGLEQEPENRDYLQLQADCLLEQGDWQGAIETLSRAIILYPKNAETIFRLGTIYSYHGEHLEALRCFKGCCELKPNHANYWEMKGETHLKLEQIPQAVTSFKKALKHGLNLDLAARLAYCWIQMNELKKGIRLYRTVLKYEPDHYDSLCNLAAVYQNQGKTNEALTLQEKAYTLCKNDPILLNNMAYTFVQMGRSRKATDLYKEALILAKGHPVILYNLAVCHVQKGNWELAIETIEEIFDIDEENSQAWALLGNIYEELAEYDLAIDCFNKSLNLA